MMFSLDALRLEAGNLGNERLALNPCEQTRFHA